MAEPWFSPAGPRVARCALAALSRRPVRKLPAVRFGRASRPPFGASPEAVRSWPARPGRLAAIASLAENELGNTY